jgi:hypothetical protein
LTRTSDGSSLEGTEWDSGAAVTTTRGAGAGTSGTAQGSDAQERLLEARAVLNLPGISFFIFFLWQERLLKARAVLNLPGISFFFFNVKNACSRPLLC